MSQSLHGLIYAESLCKPSLWISDRSDEVWNFKFDDWFTTTANPQRTPATMDASLDSLIRDAEPRKSVIRRQDLLDRFPMELIVERRDLLLDYRVCRSLSPILFFIPKMYETSLTFESARDMPCLSSLSSNLVSITNSLFRCWADRPYSVAATIGTETIPTPCQSRVIAAALDERASVDYAFLLKKPEHLPDGVTVTDLGEGVTLYKNYKAIGPVLYLRPSFDRLTENFIVFGI